MSMQPAHHRTLALAEAIEEFSLDSLLRISALLDRQPGTVDTEFSTVSKGREWSAKPSLRNGWGGGLDFR